MLVPEWFVRSAARVPVAVPSARRPRTGARHRVRGADHEYGGVMGLMEAVPVVRPESRRVRTASLPSGQQLARQLVTTVRVAEVLLHQRSSCPTGISGRSTPNGSTRPAGRSRRGKPAWPGGSAKCSRRRSARPRASTIAPGRGRDPALFARAGLRGRAAREHLRPPPRQRVRRDAVGRGGRAVGWQRKEHVAPEHRHVRADTLEALVDTVAANVNAALGAAGFGATR